MSTKVIKFCSQKGWCEMFVLKLSGIKKPIKDGRKVAGGCEFSILKTIKILK